MGGKVSKKSRSKKPITQSTEAQSGNRTTTIQSTEENSGNPISSASDKQTAFDDQSLSDENNLDNLKSSVTARMNRLQNVSDFLCDECVDDLEHLFSVSIQGTDSQTKELGDLLASLGVEKLFLRIWKKYFESDFLNDDNSPMQTVMRRILSGLCNFTDSSHVLCIQVFQSDVHSVILNYLKSDYLDPLKTVEDTYEGVIDGLLTILFNMLQKVPESSESLREQKAVDVFQRFRSSVSKQIACMALILQGYIITEKENEIVNSDDTNFVFMKEVLETALDPENSERRGYGFSPIEILSALNRLAVNDQNKTRIINAGLLPFYVQLLQPGCSVEEQAAAAEGLWTLAIKCTHEVENEPGCVSALQDLTNTNSERVKRLAEGALWTLQEFKTKKKQLDHVSKSSQEHKKHVFISYQWDSKPMIRKLSSSLKKEGFEVWVDFDNMSGSILEAMAMAVEKAAVVIVCLSQRYKDSPNCRTEAEYTFRLRKNILPLRIQPRYYPDGWLGALVGNSLVHDFSSDEKYKDSIENLIRELGNRGKPIQYEDVVDNTDSEVIVKETVSIVQSSRPQTSDCGTFSSDILVSWLQENKMEAFRDWLRGFDGSLLIEYKAMLQNAPETFYSMLKENKFSLGDMLRLTKALKQL